MAFECIAELDFNEATMQSYYVHARIYNQGFFHGEVSFFYLFQFMSFAEWVSM